MEALIGGETIAMMDRLLDTSDLGAFHDEWKGRRVVVTEQEINEYLELYPPPEPLESWRMLLRPDEIWIEVDVSGRTFYIQGNVSVQEDEALCRVERMSWPVGLVASRRSLTILCTRQVNKALEAADLRLEAVNVRNESLALSFE